MSSYLAEQFGVIALLHEYYICYRRSKFYEKAVKFYPEIFEF